MINAERHNGGGAIQNLFRQHHEADMYNLKDVAERLGVREVFTDMDVAELDFLGLYGWPFFNNHPRGLA